ncbi:hypothetical protein [Polymorphospora rubra]
MKVVIELLLLTDQPDAEPTAPEAMWGDRMPPLSLLEVEPWLRTCGNCDAGLPHPCTCPDADPRPIINRLVREVEKLHGELKQARSDAWGRRRKRPAFAASRVSPAGLGQTPSRIGPVHI